MGKKAFGRSLKHTIQEFSRRGRGDARSFGDQEEVENPFPLGMPDRIFLFKLAQQRLNRTVGNWLGSENVVLYLARSGFPLVSKELNDAGLHPPHFDVVVLQPEPPIIIDHGQRLKIWKRVSLDHWSTKSPSLMKLHFWQGSAFWNIVDAEGQELRPCQISSSVLTPPSRDIG